MRVATHRWSIVKDRSQLGVGPLAALLVAAVCCSTGAFAQQPEQPQSPSRDSPDRPIASGRGEARRSLLADMTAFKTNVRPEPFTFILNNPTPQGMCVTVTSDREVLGRIEYADHLHSNLQITPVQHLKPGVPSQFFMSLTPSVSGRAAYHWVYAEPANGDVLQLLPAASNDPRVVRVGHRSFATVKLSQHNLQGIAPRTLGPRASDFTFVVQADSHLDQGVEPKVYEQTLANMLPPIAPVQPDFMIDLGDTFMTDKRGADFKSALAQYDAQRYYFSRVAHSVPLFMVLGNHDGEKGTSGKNTEDIGPWSYSQRTSRFPPPMIDDLGAIGKSFYSGSTALRSGVGSNYYAFEWGDAQIIVLDPYWTTTARVRGGGGSRRGAGERGGSEADRDARGGGKDDQRRDDEPLQPTDTSWAMTLGRTQYDWLTTTLEHSKARYRFVFIHHLVGGVGGAEARGGVESSVFFEWGGQNADGSPGFTQRRPGWAMPIHDLLVKHHVSAVFHGHDHLYVHNQRDGVVYQCVPQPGNPRGNTRTAAIYGYASGTVLGSPGHVRVRVGPDNATVEFVRTAIDGLDAQPARGQRRDTTSSHVNGQVVHSYTLAPGGAMTQGK